MDIEPTVVQRPKYPPKVLTKYAARKRMKPQDALVHALKTNRSNSDAAREIGIAPRTLQRWIKDWKIEIHR